MGKAKDSGGIDANLAKQPLSIISVDGLELEPATWRCSSCPFGGGAVVNWDQNTRKCAVWKMAPNDRCFFAYTGQPAPDFETPDGWFSTVRRALSIIWPNLEILLQMQVATGCGREALKTLDKMMKMLTAMQAGIKTVKAVAKLTDDGSDKPAEIAPEEAAEVLLSDPAVRDAVLRRLGISEPAKLPAQLQERAPEVVCEEPQPA